MPDNTIWDNLEFHDHPDQLSRQKSAAGKKLTPISVDHENKTCQIKGSGKSAYEVNLSSCTCSDFMKRKMPCKHMYRLAHELGIFMLFDVAETKIVQHSNVDDVTKYVNRDTGEILERKASEAHKAIQASKDFLDILTPKQLLDIRQMFRSNLNHEYGTWWHVATLDKSEAKLLVGTGLFDNDEASTKEKLEMLSRHQVEQILDKIDKKKTINRRSQVNTWKKKLLADFQDETEAVVSDKVVLMKTTPLIWEYGAIYNHIKKLLFEFMYCVECLSRYLERSGLRMEEAEAHFYYAEKSDLDGKRQTCVL